MSEPLLVDYLGPIVKITLNRPDDMNALNPELLVALKHSLAELASLKEVRAVILTGAGRAFCAGVDISSIAGLSDEEAAGQLTRPALESIDLIENMPSPVIAAVNGFCLTGGLELVLACDIIVASDRARFGDTHAKWGLTPIWGGSQRLPRTVGAMKAKELMFTCDIVGANEARKIGLVNKVVPHEKLDETVVTMAQKICANSPYAIREEKHLINKGRMMTLEGGLKMAALEAPGPTQDCEARLAQFMGQKKP